MLTVTERLMNYMTDKEIIESLKTLISESYAGNPIVARHTTIIRDCKKESFDFVIKEAIKTICYHNQIKIIKENSFFGLPIKAGDNQ